jgi:uncharacterized cupin superfamily protein
MANLNEPDFDDNRDTPGFTRRRARLGRQAGAERLGLSLFELPPGQAAYPYHYHLGEEELLVILEGSPSMRGPDGWSELSEGDVLSFPVGEGGGHQLANRGEGRVRFLAISTGGAPDLVVYPDSDKLGAFQRLPDGGGLYELYRRSDAVDYMDGEAPPG